MQTLPHIHSSQAAKVWKSAARTSKAKPLPTDLQETKPGRTSYEQESNHVPYLEKCNFGS